MDSLRRKGVAHDVTLNLAFAQDEEVDLVQVDVPIVGGFEVHKRDSHVDNMLAALDGLLLIPQAWYFRNDELTCANFSLWDFDRCDPLVLILYGDMIIFTGCPK